MKSYKLKELVSQVISGEWGEEANNVLPNVKVIRTTNFTNTGQLNLDKGLVYRHIDSTKIQKKQLNFGDTIIEKSGGSPTQPVGRVVFFDKIEDTYLCNNFTSILRPNTEIVEPKYLFYLLFNLYQQRKVMKYQNNTTGIINLKLDQYLTGTEIIIPNKKIQNKIIEILDSASLLINKRLIQLTALDELAHSIFLEKFGDPKNKESKYPLVKLSDVCNKITDGTHHSPPMVSEGVPYVSAKHLGKGFLDFHSNPSYISKEDHIKIFKRCDPELGDVLYIKDGATTGIAGINYYDFEFSMLSSLALIKPNLSKLNNYYLVYFLNNPRVKENILNQMNGGAIKRLTIKKIKNLDVLLPPIEVQNGFMNTIKKVEEQKIMFEKSLYVLTEIYNSSLQKAFRGELFPE